MTQPGPRPATDRQLADWMDNAARHGAAPASVSDLDDLDALTSLAAEVLDDHGATHRIENIAVYVLHDGSSEALIAVEHDHGLGLCSLTFSFPFDNPRSPGEALHWLLAAADEETSRLDNCLAARAHKDLPTIAAQPAPPADDAATFEVSFWLHARYSTTLAAAETAAQLRAAGLPQAADIAGQIARRELTAGEASEYDEDQPLGYLAAAIARVADKLGIAPDGEPVEHDDAETYRVWVG